MKELPGSISFLLGAVLAIGSAFTSGKIFPPSISYSIYPKVSNLSVNSINFYPADFTPYQAYFDLNNDLNSTTPINSGSYKNLGIDYYENDVRGTILYTDFCSTMSAANIICLVEVQVNNVLLTNKATDYIEGDTFADLRPGFR